MTKRSEQDWLFILSRLGVKPVTAARWAPVFAAEIKPGTLSAGDAELDDFLGQVLHESAMLERIEEGLTYTRAERLCEVWPSRFKTAAEAAACVRNPQALANRVYGGRMGNTQLGDGWRYRGRGLIQVTGRDNYTALSKALGLDLVGNPDLLAQPAIALRASIAWWEGNVPDAVMGDIQRVTRRVNGGTVGLADRIALTGKAREVLG